LLRDLIDAPNFIGVTGLPRAGSTLLCQMLAQHPEIHCDGRSSLLCAAVLGIRRMVSDDQYFLSQPHHQIERP
jgi:sulfotransferase